MYGPNLETRRTIQHAMHTLMGLPFNWTKFKRCYWKSMRQFVIFRMEYGEICTIFQKW
jgi:hypothetical protein